MIRDQPRLSNNTPSTSTPVLNKGAIKDKKQRKIGHRRVGSEGEITYKNIKSSQITGSIQLGISHAIGGQAEALTDRDVLVKDFMTVETTYFSSRGSQQTPAHRYSDFHFQSFAPAAFRYFRDLFGIRHGDFLRSMCGSDLRELNNPGASDSMFYLSGDDEFILKTVQRKEEGFLLKLLLGYFMNLHQNPCTLLPKFFGLYCYQCNFKNVRLVVMNNILPSSVKMHEMYDLKGSTHMRKASKFERSKVLPTFKDLDFLEIHPEGLVLEKENYAALVNKIQRDCLFLESFRIIDYSLLLGIHNLDLAANDGRVSSGKGGGAEAPAGAGVTSYPVSAKTRQKLMAHSIAMESIRAESELSSKGSDAHSGGIPARNGKGERLLLFLGIIDILQSYDLTKKLEHAVKAVFCDEDTISVQRPGFYSARFQNFMAKKVFRMAPSSKKRPSSVVNVMHANQNNEHESR